MNINPEFGTTIRSLRKAAGLTLKELAAQVYIDFSYLSKIEKATLPPPSQDIIFRLAEVFSVDADKLFKLAGLNPYLVDEALIEKTAALFGKKIKELRYKARLSQGDLASMTGIDPSYLSKIENGTKSPPSRKVISRLAEALKVSENDLMNRAGKSSHPGYTKKFIRRLTDSMKNPANSIMKSTWSRATVALVLVICIASALWFATPAAAINITFPTVPSSGYVGQTYTFTTKVDVQNTDLLPINSVELEIYNIANPGTNFIVTGLPLPSGPCSWVTKNYTTAGGAVCITGSTDNTWGYGYSNIPRTGYGYGYQSPSYGYGYQTNTSGYGYGYGYAPYVGSTSIIYTVSWCPTFPVGTYGVKTKVYGGASNKFFTNSSPATFTIYNLPYSGTNPTPTPTPTPVATSTVTPTTTPTANSITGTGIVDVSSVVNSSGIFTQHVEVSSSDSLVQVEIDQNVVGKTQDGLPLTQISVVPMATSPAAPAQSNIIGLTYDLGPDGATFNPAITLTFTYDPAQVPAGVDPSTLVIAFYNNATAQWVSLTDITVDPVTHVITGKTTHFTPFTVIAFAKPAATVPAATTPAVTTPAVTTPAVTTTAPTTGATTPTATTDSPTTTSNWLLIAGIIGAVAVIGLIVIMSVRRKKSA